MVAHFPEKSFRFSSVEMGDVINTKLVSSGAVPNIFMGGDILVSGFEDTSPPTTSTRECPYAYSPTAVRPST